MAPARLISWLARDWTVGGVLKYASGSLMQSPESNITLWNTMGIGGTPLNGVSNFGGAEPLENYVPGQSCLAINPNSHFDPTKTLVLNPNAWSEPDHGNVWRRGALLHQLPVAAPAGRISQPGPDFPHQRKAPVVDSGAVLQCVQSCGLSRADCDHDQHNARHVRQPVPGRPDSGFGQNAALNGGYGFVNTLNGAGTNP